MAYPATGTGSNVTTGPGWLYVAPLATADPTSASAALPSAWQEIGFTDAGSTFTTDITSENIEVAESLDPVRRVQTTRVTTLAFAMAETTRRNFFLAVGAGLTVNNEASITLPDLDELLSVKLIHQAETGARWLFRKVAPSGQISLQNAKAPAKRLIAVTMSIEVPDAGAEPVEIWPAAGGII